MTTTLKQPKFCLTIPDGYPYDVQIGKYCYATSQPSVEFFPDSHAKLRIGNFVSFGPKVMIYVGGEHEYRFVSTYPFPLVFDTDVHYPPTSKGDVCIGSDVWIGGNATILSGVTIGHGAVVGAGSIVTRNVPSYSVVVGNPAKVIKYRFTVVEICELLDIRWWEWEDALLEQCMPLLMQQNVCELVMFAKNHAKYKGGESCE